MKEKNLPLISIIVPCYNHGEYIHECIDSVHNQGYKNYEIIVINDGSTDSYTNEVIQKISHPQIKIFETKNQGPSLSRNLGIKNSKGKYILPLDADNKVGKEFIKNAIEILEGNENIKIVNCDIQLFGAKKREIKLEPFSIRKILGKNIIECASVFRRSDFDKTNGYNSNMKEGLEDWDFWLSILESGGDVYKIDKAQIFYRVNKASRNNSITPEGFKRLRYQIYQNHKELYAKHFFDPLESFEYDLIIKSKEYKFGKFLLKPIRKIYNFFH